MKGAKSWRREIDFQCRFGIWPFKKTLNISSAGFEWCGTLIPLKEITRLRWGVEQKRGGIFPKRVCVAVFGTAAREYTIRTKQKDFYSNLVERYWKAAGRRLLTELLDGLGADKNYVFDSVTLGDCGIAVSKKGIFGGGSDFYEWSALGWGVVNGSLCFVSLAAPDKPLAGLSFLRTDNTHLLNVALKLLSQSRDSKKLSELPRNF